MRCIMLNATQTSELANKCHKLFLIHRKTILKRKKISYVGIPRNDIAESGFQTIMLRLEKNKRQTSIADLVREMHMEELCCVDNTYSVVHLKRKIKEYFGKSILFTEEGKPSVLTFRDNADIAQLL